ncbi:hypothetical protein ACFL2A_02745 [Thermodesulfobacteriota bacterium]
MPSGKPSASPNRKEAERFTEYCRLLGVYCINYMAKSVKQSYVI